MQTVPSTWGMTASAYHDAEFKAVINGVTYTYADIKSASITKSMMDKISIGQAVSAELDMVFKPNGTIPSAAKIECYVRLATNEPLTYITADDGYIIQTDDGYNLASVYPTATDWIPFGTFFIDTRSTDAFGWMTITAYDAMLSAEISFPDTFTPGTMSKAVDYIAESMGVTVDSRSEIAPFNIDSPVGLYTMREVLCGIAAASGGNFIITENNQLRLIRLASPTSSDDVPVVTCDVLSDELTVGQVTLYPDSDTMYNSGSDGYEIQADCIYATQEICDHVLSLLEGVTYLAYTAGTAFLDPALELGDTVRVDNKLSIMASATFTIGKSMTATIEANIDTELNHEYPYQSRTSEERSLAVSQSRIEKTTKEIKLAVEGKLDADEVQSAIDVTLEGITLSYSQGTSGASIALTKDGVEIGGSATIDSIDASLVNVENLNASNITTGELTSDYIYLYNEVAIHTSLGGDPLNPSGEVGGYFGYYESDGVPGLHMTYESSLASSASSEVTATQNGARMSHTESGTTNSAYVTSSGFYVNCPAMPASSGSYTLGSSTYKWSTVYATTGQINTSDRNQKADISYDLTVYDALFDKLKPVSYKLKDGESGRTHTGLIAQDVEEALKEVGLTGTDFAGFVKTPNDNGFDYGLRYDELIALCIRQIQELKKRVKELEDRQNG